MERLEEVRPALDRPVVRLLSLHELADMAEDISLQFVDEFVAGIRRRELRA
jgi:hypothetical protein